MDTKIFLKNLIYDAIKEAFEQTSIAADEIILNRPKLSRHGDFFVNIAMRLAKNLKASPMSIAGFIVERIEKRIEGDISLRSKISKIETKQPGFINFFLTNFALCGVIKRIQDEGAAFGSSAVGKGKKIQIEFVSANPTGPLSVAHGRQAAVGDSLGNILEFAGWKVVKEYFINDEGRQMDCLGESVRMRYLELLGKKFNFPEDGYKGRYIYDIARSIIDRYGDKYTSFTEAEKRFFRSYACSFIIRIIKKELKDFDVHFDVWTSQAKLVKSKKIEKAFKRLKRKGFLYKLDGAVWFKSTVFGDDKDRVVVKSDGSFTYLAPDIAYHQDKFKRGFSNVIDIWGPDHHGYIPRISAAVQALGYPKNAMNVLIVQLSTLYKGREQISMSTRSGEFITLRQVINDVGRDAARFFFTARKISSHLDFDIELAKKQSQENPVYYVQYAHARISNIIKFAKKSAGFRALLPPKTDLKLLKEPEEMELLKTLSQFPSVINSCAESLEPCGIVSYLLNLSGIFHLFYDKHRVVVEDLHLSNARLLLIDSVRVVIAAGLKLLGVSAPEKM